MAWAKFDDDYMGHPKIRARSAYALRLHMSAILHCCKWGTDGFIDGETLRELLPRREFHEDYVRELVGNNLLHDHTNRCQSPDCLAIEGLPLDGTDGFVVHDFRQWQLTADEWDEKKAEKERRGKFGMHKRWHVQRGVKADDCEHCQADSG